MSDLLNVFKGEEEEKKKKSNLRRERNIIRGEGKDRSEENEDENKLKIITKAEEEV